MQDEIAVDLGELTKLYVACPNGDCNAEVGFDLTQNQRIRPMACPLCGRTLMDVEMQDNFRFTWVWLVQKLVRAEGRPRMFFRVQRPAR